MGRKLFEIFVFCFIFLFSSCFVEATEEKTVQYVRSGTFLKVVNLAEFSSLVADVDDEIVFMNTQDMYIYETNAIPANTKIYGYVEDVLEPVEGRDGAIKIAIYKMITPDRKVYKVKGHIYTQNDNYLGGRKTDPTIYRKVPYYNDRMRPFLRVAPLDVLEMGKHTVVLPGAELYVILEEDMIVK